MWVLSGPFDSVMGSELNFQKDKLLKTNTTYPVGRKDRPLVVGSKKVSHDHCEFIVGPYSTDDVLDPSSRPTLQFINKKDKGMKLFRGGLQFVVNPGATQELEHGDTISIIGGVSIAVKWVPICCFYPKSSVSLDICASLAINLVHTVRSDTTHCLTNNYTDTPLIAASLITACQLVKPEWLHEVIRLGNLPRNNDPANGTSLEDTFVLPQTSKFRPNFSPTLPLSQKTFKLWEPSEERMNIFQSYCFVCLCENTTSVDGDLRQMISQGKGSFEAFDVHGGASKLRRALSRGQAKKGKRLILIGDPEAMQAAVGEESWEELVAEAKSVNLQFVPPTTIIQAVIEADNSIFEQPSNVEAHMDVDESHQTLQSPLPDFIPNTHPDEPSIVPTGPEHRAAPARKLTRRVTSRQASQEPSALESGSQREIEAPRPRRALTKRVNAGKPVVTGLDDSSAIFNATPDLSDLAKPSAPPIVDLAAPTPARSNRLKRRVVGVVDAPDSLDTQGLGMSIDRFEEPPLKKFKALFDATNPEKGGNPLAESSQDMQSDPFGGSLTQSETQTGTELRTRRRLGSVATIGSLGLLQEEEEETQSLAKSTANQQGKKRALASIDEDEEMQGEQSVGIGSGPGPLAVKKRAVENVNAVERTESVQDSASSKLLGHKPASSVANRKPSSSAAKHGAPTGKPDTDAAFLKAIASTKRGKKSEDQFDREFNKLKISKPDLDREEQEDEWKVIADFGDDTGVRGNFMVVLDMDVFSKDGDHRRRNVSVLSQWEGKPNFKKFKRKNATGTRSNKVELVISEESNYGIGASYWKGGDGQSQTENKFPTNQKPISQAKSQGMILNDSDSDVVEAPQKGRSKPSSRAGSAMPKRASTRAKPVAKLEPLFLDSDDDINEDEDEQAIVDPGANDDEQTIRSTAGTKTSAPRPTSRKTSNPTPIMVDDDSDDDAVFKRKK